MRRKISSAHAKGCLICITDHKRNSHTLIIDGAVIVSMPTEVELSQAARTMGINFRELRSESTGPAGTTECTTNWYGTQSQRDYLAWKGTVGQGQWLRQIVKHYNQGTP